MASTNKKEQWKEIRLGIKNQRTHYAISNLGSICSFKMKIDDGKRLNGTIVNGYPALKLKINSKDYQFYIHKLVAEHFIKKSGKTQTYVLHVNHDKLNNKVTNLKWASRDDMEKHQQKSPLVKAYRERTKVKGHKLTAIKVRSMKEKMFSKNRKLRMKDIAKQFGISEMQLYRIKSGYNWGHVKV